MTPVDTCPMRKLTIVTATSMRFIGSRNWLERHRQTDGGFSPVICVRADVRQAGRRLRSRESACPHRSRARPRPSSASWL